MNFKAWLSKLSIPQKDLYCKLSIVFAIFFIVPIAGLLYFSLKYKIFNDKHLSSFILVLLAFFFIGYGLLRKMVDNITSISTSMAKTVEAEISRKPLIAARDERGNIVQSFKVLLEESKLLTLLNIDIRDFSPLSKKIGPKKTVDILNYFFSIMGEIVFKHQGIVDKYLGDGFLAVFGAPVSSTSDAENAMRAALEMQNRMDEVNENCQKNSALISLWAW